MNCTLKRRRRLSWTFTTSPMGSETTNRSDQRSTTRSRRPSTKTALSSASTIPRARRWSPPFRPTSPPPSPTCELRFWRGAEGGRGAGGGVFCRRLLVHEPEGVRAPTKWNPPTAYRPATECALWFKALADDPFASRVWLSARWGARLVSGRKAVRVRFDLPFCLKDGVYVKAVLRHCPSHNQWNVKMAHTAAHPDTELLLVVTVHITGTAPSGPINSSGFCGCKAYIIVTINVALIPAWSPHSDYIP